MRKISMTLCVILAAMALMTGCKEDTSGHIVAYTAGRSLYLGVYAVIPESIKLLEERYDKFLEETKGQDVVTSMQSVTLYNDLVMIMLAYEADPYGLLNNLSFLMGLFGAEFVTVDGNELLSGIKEIPLAYYLSFARGWDSSALMIMLQER